MDSDDRPRRSGLLDVGDGNDVYWEEWGAADGVPALYVHGGPGGALGASAYRERFDLGATRVVGFEQRGCGRSTPHAGDAKASLATNDTPHLVADMEALRVHLGIDAWVINGVSWGSTLALAYAQEHAARVLGVVLYAVTTTSRSEVDWITEGMGAIFPEAWDRFAGHAERAGIGYRRGEARLVEAYARLLESPDPQVRDAASREWALWEDTHVSIGAGGFHRHPRWDDDRFRHAFARLTTHYWSHDGFCDPPILERMNRLRSIPATLVHGRRDISSPVTTAWRLHRSWPGSELLVDEGDGHGGTSMTARWYAANAALVARVRRQHRSEPPAP
ncbi:alpha/beta fold hydrolase [Intrasporangium flavum]|uniref:alpha/beta fold hydrolase n=1 Tax=Intrasporangium flavum TaxID=1428657 RepID=UPI00096D6EC2|nr:alpha/beta fold hydrolase [Intrasporangium flavum]